MEKKWGAVNKSELTLSLSEKFPGLRIEAVKFAIDNILEQMSEALSVEKRIEVRGFGSFELCFRLPGISRNSKTGRSNRRRLSISRISEPARNYARELIGKESDRYRINLWLKQLVVWNSVLSV